VVPRVISSFIGEIAFFLYTKIVDEEEYMLQDLYREPVMVGFRSNQQHGMGFREIP
jgi:hypothetical protein